jgi:signal transduction histidine kinase/CheY-like chemotaxis protein
MLGMAFCASMIALAPLIFNLRLLHSHTEQGTNRLIEALHSPQSGKNIMFLFATTVPMLADVLAFVFHRDSFFFFERVIILCAFIVPLIVLMSAPSFDTGSVGIDDIYLSLAPVQTIWSSVALLAGILTSQQTHIWTPTRVYTLLFIVCIVQALVPYTELPGNAGHSFLITCNFGFWLGFLHVLYHYVWYLVTVWSLVTADNAEASTSAIIIPKLSASEYLALLCSTMVVGYCVAFFVGSFLWEISFPHTVRVEALAYNLALIGAVTIIVTLLPGRIARSQVREVESYLENKKSFVRYIGHEIRTPLNVASIGLDLLASHDSVEANKRVLQVNSRPRQPPASQSEAADHAGLRRTQVSAAGHYGMVQTNQLLQASYDDKLDLNHESDDGMDDYMCSMLPTEKSAVGPDILTPNRFSDHEGQSYCLHCKCSVMEDQSRSDSDDLKTSERANVLSEVRRAIALSTDILNDLLSYDKLDSDNMHLDMGYMDVDNFIYSALSMFMIQASAKRIKFLVNVEENLPLLKGDEYKLRQVMCNLASNALKFTPSEGIVYVDVRRQHSHQPRSQAQKMYSKYTNSLIITVKDSGVGIAKHNLTKVFKKIIQFDANANQAGNGTGLGLYITRGLVELHGGTVSVRSEGLNCGCVFTVTLPLDGGESRRRRSTITHVTDFHKFVRLVCVRFCVQCCCSGSGAGARMCGYIFSVLKTIFGREFWNGGYESTSSSNQNISVVSREFCELESQHGSNISTKPFTEISSYPQTRRQDSASSRGIYHASHQHIGSRDSRVVPTEDAIDSGPCVNRNNYLTDISTYYSSKTTSGILTDQVSVYDNKSFSSRHAHLSGSLRSQPHPATKVDCSVVRNSPSPPSGRRILVPSLSLTQELSKPHPQDDVHASDAGALHSFAVATLSPVSNNQSTTIPTNTVHSKPEIMVPSISPALQCGLRHSNLVEGAAASNSTSQGSAAEPHAHPSGHTARSSGNSICNNLVISNSGSSVRESPVVTSRSEMNNLKLTARSQSLAQQANSSCLEGLTALLVDDSGSSLKMLAMLMKRLGCKCVCAEDGEEAVRLVSASLQLNAQSASTSIQTINEITNLSPATVQYDFIMMDNFMPIMCGPEACRRMRQLGYQNPVVGLTGHALGDDVRVYKEAGANEVLSKPLDVILLQEVLSKNGIYFSGVGINTGTNSTTSCLPNQSTIINALKSSCRDPG